MQKPLNLGHEAGGARRFSRPEGFRRLPQILLAPGEFVDK